MLIHQLLPGRQLSLSGSIYHLPIEIGTCFMLNEASEVMDP